MDDQFAPRIGNLSADQDTFAGRRAIGRTVGGLPQRMGVDQPLRPRRGEPATTGSWRLTVDSSLPLGSAAPADDAVTGLSPDWPERVWFATGGGVVGTADDWTGTVRSVALPAGEWIANSISTAPQGTAVTTTHATYLLTASTDGTPRISWRQA